MIHSKKSKTQRCDIFAANVSANKELFKGRESINLNISNVFNSRVSRRDTFRTSFLSTSEYQYFERQINLTFTYRFKNTIEHRDNGDDEDYEES